MAQQAMVDDLMTQLTAIVNIHPDCRDVPTMLVRLFFFVS